MAARLAFDLAVLNKRVGDLDGFASNLALAVELDPGFPVAVDTAAGFFRMAEDDILAEFELLVAAVVANPINDFFYRTLGEGLLRQGAYDGAAEILDLGQRLASNTDPDLVSLEEDLAVAWWGAGRRQSALDSIDRAIKVQSTLSIQRMKREDPNLNLLSVLRTTPPVNPQLALVKAAILSTGPDRDAFEAYLPELAQAFQTTRAIINDAMSTARKDGETERVRELNTELGELAADEAWARIWFLEDRSGVPDLIDKALEAEAIQPDQGKVLEGWLALREGRYAEAGELLAGLAEDSPYAEVGLALIDLQEGRQQTAARRLLAVYRNLPGKKLGIWSRDRLSRLLGAEIPLPEGADVLNALIASMPEGVARAVRDLRGVLAMSIEPEKNPMGPFDPLRVTITIRNSLSIPLNIGPGGPLKPNLAIVADITAAATNPPAMKPIIIPLDRQFSIPARGELVIHADLSATRLGMQLDSMALQGASIRLRAVVNYRILQDNLTMGDFGEQITSVPIRLNGAYRLNEANTDLLNLIKQIRDPRTIEDLQAIALVGQYYRLSLSWIEDLRSSMREALIDSFSKLPPYARAWALSQLPRDTESFVRLIDAGLSTDNPAVYAVLLTEWAKDPGSPVIVSGRQSSVPEIRAMAEAALVWTSYLEEMKRKAYELGEDDAVQDPLAP